MVHLVESDKSASGGKGGKRYSAYLIDIRSYSSPLLTGFTQKGHGVKNDAGPKIQSKLSPILNFNEFAGFPKISPI